MMEDSFIHMKPGDKVVLVSGDRDYLPTIESLRARGIATLVAFWRHATGHELKQAPIHFFALDPLFDYRAQVVAESTRSGLFGSDRGPARQPDASASST